MKNSSEFDTPTFQTEKTSLILALKKLSIS